MAPVDVKERELHNLLRWLPEFEASHINFKGDQPWASRSSPLRTRPSPPRPRCSCRTWCSMRRPSRRCTPRWQRRTSSSREVWEPMQMMWTIVNVCRRVETILIHLMLHLRFIHPHQLSPCGELQVISLLHLLTTPMHIQCSCAVCHMTPFWMVLMMADWQCP